MDPAVNDIDNFENVIGPQIVILHGSSRKASVHRGMINYLK